MSLNYLIVKHFSWFYFSLNPLYSDLNKQIKQRTLVYPIIPYYYLQGNPWIWLDNCCPLILDSMLPIWNSGNLIGYRNCGQSKGLICKLEVYYWFSSQRWKCHYEKDAKTSVFVLEGTFLCKRSLVLHLIKQSNVKDVN